MSNSGGTEGAGNGKQPQVNVAGVDGNDNPTSTSGLSERQPLLRPTNRASEWKAPVGFVWIEIGMTELECYISNCKELTNFEISAYVQCFSIWI